MQDIEMTEELSPIQLAEEDDKEEDKKRKPNATEFQKSHAMWLAKYSNYKGVEIAKRTGVSSTLANTYIKSYREGKEEIPEIYLLDKTIPKSSRVITLAINEESMDIEKAQAELLRVFETLNTIGIRRVDIKFEVTNKGE